MLSRAIRPAAFTFTAPMAIRTLSTTPMARKPSDDNGSAVRRNPLIGGNAPPPPSPQQETAAPVADAAPEASTPPPPPPPPAAAATEAAAPAETAPETKTSGYVDIAKLLDNHAAAYARTINKTTDPLNQPRVRCTPVSGRTVFLEGQRRPGTAHTPEQAFNLLRRIVRTGQIKSLWHRQRFHERPGLRRKRLKSERWRARFKQGFQATTERVRELKKQGW